MSQILTKVSRGDRDNVIVQPKGMCRRCGKVPIAKKYDLCQPCVAKMTAALSEQYKTNKIDSVHEAA